ncbi:hypothetical protein ASPZODRAFT_149339 [Penicilliopsis zonata CBS 506.65]|uniref:DASH complex subunit ASK1 n=1 Tax=Penicilliopsis zonata CBS 506.65 TaxID=1073090 RepID=A0A1L9SRY9_9EURO|nr:hypothetical protein ASPZODRAFT_149339 [Penicilliopsis zonata CBS 506.65]OJJ49883.1 hypothetical protein ASPZODRAFT_149339 [Penicilliopsis zonata CBS 506.65]
MSRHPQPQRPLSLTEELEKLEQSITLTLQEIDHNFSEAHRIVTTSILPVVEQYAENSRDVWEGAKFWKQFFEASANVSLSGYEDRPNEDTTLQEQSVTEDESSANITQETITDSASYETPSREHPNVNHHHEDLDLSALTLSSHSTPRAEGSRERGQQPSRINDEGDTTAASIAYTSPYENLRQEISQGQSPFEIDSSTLPSTPGKPSRPYQGYEEDISGTLMSSPFVPPVSHDFPPSTGKKANYSSKPSDPVLHHMLDKTYRVQATPLGKGYHQQHHNYGAGAGPSSRSKFTVTPKTKTSKYYDSPMSSPEPEAPQLHTELFSPLKTRTPKRRPSSHAGITPQPGISVLTPAKYSAGTGMSKRQGWDSDDDDDDELNFDYHDDDLGPSPPKTMQFHIPQSRLMKTPAKEASKRIVEDLLATAGADTTDDLYDEQSPSVIRRVERLEDETF